LLFLAAVVLPFGWLAHRLVTAAPRLFQQAGWDVQPLEPVREQELYPGAIVFRPEHRAPHSWSRQWLRGAQGWVYIEIAVILLGNSGDSAFFQRS
jgi:hypothetical protein